MKHQSVFEQFAKGLGDAIGDIRTRLVDEGWFQRGVNWRDGSVSQPIEGWPQAREAQPELGEHDREADLDLDR